MKSSKKNKIYLGPCSSIRNVHHNQHSTIRFLKKRTLKVYKTWKIKAQSSGKHYFLFARASWWWLNEKKLVVAEQYLGLSGRGLKQEYLDSGHKSKWVLLTKLNANSAVFLRFILDVIVTLLKPLQMESENTWKRGEIQKSKFNDNSATIPFPQPDTIVQSCSHVLTPCPSMKHTNHTKQDIKWINKKYCFHKIFGEICITLWLKYLHKGYWKYVTFAGLLQYQGLLRSIATFCWFSPVTATWTCEDAGSGNPRKDKRKQISAEIQILSNAAVYELVYSAMSRCMVI